MRHLKKIIIIVIQKFLPENSYAVKKKKIKEYATPTFPIADIQLLYHVLVLKEYPVLFVSLPLCEIPSPPVLPFQTHHARHGSTFLTAR